MTTLSDMIAPHRNVKLKMTKAQRAAYTPPKGINVMFYGPNNTPLQIDSDKECYATFYTPILNPDEDFQKYLDDIDNELSNLRVLQDHVTTNHEPKLVKPHVEVHVLIDKIKDNPRYQPYLRDLDEKKKRMVKLSGDTIKEEDVTTVRL